jgi:hypothetical protein
MNVADDDLARCSVTELAAEVRRLWNAIREHRDSSLHDLCWHQPALWSLLREPSDPIPAVPEWPSFLRGCVAYRQSLDDQLPQAERVRTEYRLDE